MATGCFLNPALRHQRVAAKLRHRNSMSWPTTRGGDVSKRILMEFTTASNDIQKIVTRNSKIGWTEETCVEMDKLAQENHFCCPLSEAYERYKKNWYISLNKSGRNATMKLRSDFREAVTIMNRLHRESAIPKVQCSQCLLFWNQGVIYCTCGHLLVESESSQHFHQWRLDALSIPRYVIKKGRPHGARHGKTEAQKQYHIAFNAWKRCRKRVDGQGIHDRFLRDQVFRDSQLKIGRT